MSTSPSLYPLSIRLLHWAMAIAILGLIASGWYMAQLPDEAPNKYDLYPLHKSFGVLVLILFPLRLWQRLRKTMPDLPALLQSWEVRAAHAGHVALYVLMLAVPVSGYVMSGSYEGGHGIGFFGLVLPRIVPTDDTLFALSHVVHEWLPWVLLAVVVLHVAGVVKHRWFDAEGVDVLPRMLRGEG